MQTDSSPKDLKTNGLSFNTFINLCKFFPEWEVKGSQVDEFWMETYSKINGIALD